MTSRERITAALRHQEPDRIPMLDTCFWTPTVERWLDEGLPEGVSPHQHFELDSIPRLGIDCSLQFDVEIIEETDEWTVKRDRDGAVHKRWIHQYATEAEVDQFLTGPDVWADCRDRLQPTEDRIAGATPEQITQLHERGEFVVLGPNEPVWWTWRALGMPRALMAMAAEPEWFEEMVAVQTEMQLDLFRQIIERGEKPDGIWFYSDFCYAKGTFFSAQMYRDLMLPYHRRVADFCHANDMFLLLHCCGDCRELIPLLIEAGFDAVQPLEARAGNDVRELKRLHGDGITLFGNINVDVLSSGDRDAIRHEVQSKLEAAMPGGGYIYHSDHSIPPTVAMADYAYALELVREYGRYT